MILGEYSIATRSLTPVSKEGEGATQRDDGVLCCLDVFGKPRAIKLWISGRQPGLDSGTLMFYDPMKSTEAPRPYITSDPTLPVQASHEQSHGRRVFLCNAPLLDAAVRQSVVQVVLPC
jgi:hypothetical protein